MKKTTRAHFVAEMTCHARAVLFRVARRYQLVLLEAQRCRITSRLATPEALKEQHAYPVYTVTTYIYTADSWACETLYS